MRSLHQVQLFEILQQLGYGIDSKKIKWMIGMWVGEKILFQKMCKTLEGIS